MSTSFRSFTICILLATLLAVVSSACGTKGGTLASISLEPSNPVIVKGGSVQLIAMALFTNGIKLLSWSIVTWSSSDTTIATVSSSGQVTGLAAGMTTITAVDTGHPDIRSSITLIVTETALQSLIISLPSSTLAVGTGQQCIATGLYTAPTLSPSLDLTQTVLWISSDPAIAAISRTVGAKGFVTAVSAGTVTITATEPVSNITGTVSLTVQ